MTYDPYAHIATRFDKETADHEMTILHDDGLYRHVKFQRPGSSAYWFELVTAPGSLTFQGDGESYVFARIDDMFTFFRDTSGWNQPRRINPGYWGEKVTSDRANLQQYSEEMFIEGVTKAFVEDVRERRVPLGAGRALRRDVLDPSVTAWENEAISALYHFEYKGYGFTDTWQWNFRNWDWWFLWALHGIVAGINQYDQAKA